MKRKKKLLQILLAVLMAINQLIFFVPLNADETESGTETVLDTQTESETETEASSETTKESEIVISKSEDVTSAGNAKEFVKGVSRLPKKYRIMTSSKKKSRPKFKGAKGIDYGGSLVLSFESEEEYDQALRELEKSKTGYSVDGSFTICSDVPSAILKDVKINPDAKTKIAVIDTGSDLANEKISVLGDDGNDANGHGTLMSSLILEQTDDAYIISVKAIGDNGKGSVSDVYAAVRYAIDHGCEYILMAISLKDNGNYGEFVSIIKEASDKGIKVVASAGNNGTDASKYLPAGIKGVITAGAVDDEGYKISTSNYGSSVDYYIPAFSTSEASAVLTGLLIAGKADSCMTSYKTKEDSTDPEITGTPEEAEDDEFTVNRSSMTWPTKSDLISAGYYHSDLFGAAVIEACKAMKGVSYGTGNGQADCMRYVNLAYAQALHLISGLKVSNGKIPGVTRSNGVVKYNGTNLSGSKYKLVDGCTTWAKTSPHKIGVPGGLNIKNNGGLEACLKKLGAMKGSIILFGGKNSSGTFRYTHAAIYAGSGKTVYDSPGGSQTAGVPYSKSEGGSGSKTYTHVAVLNYATYNYDDKTTVTKTSSNTALTGDNACYSLEGTRYGLYNSSDTLIHEFVLDKDGKTDIFKFTDLNDKYYVRELSAGRGYKVNTKKYNVDLKAPTSTGLVTVKVSDDPVSSDGVLILEKKDTDCWSTVTDAQMSGAVFRVDYYDSTGIESYKDLTGEDGNAKPKVKASVEISGKDISGSTAQFEFSCKTLSEADSSGYFAKLKGLDKLPIGTYVITEITAPEGYTVADQTKPLIMKIRQEGDNAVTYYTADPSLFQVLEDKIVLSEKTALGKAALLKKITVKEDDETDISAYSPEGTTYEIYYKTSGNPAVTVIFGKDGKPAEIIYPEGIKVTNEGGTIILPAGDYCAKETHSGYGLYLDTTEKEFTVTEDKVTAFEFSDEPVYTGFDCLLKKVKSNVLSEQIIPMIPVEGAQFELSYYAGFYEGESYKDKTPSRKWIFRTDEEGKLYYDAHHLVSGDDLFENGAGEYIVPQGTYVLKEVKAPSGATASKEARVIVVRFAKDIVKGSSADPGKTWASLSTMFSETVTGIKDGVLEFYNEYDTSVSTLAVSTANGSKQIAAVTGVGITDILTYKNFLPGFSYKIRSWLVRSDGTAVVKPFDTTVQISGENERNGMIKIPFVIDASGLQGETLTVMEEIYIINDAGKEILYLKHDDINNKDQQIQIPNIRTELIDEKIDEYKNPDNLKFASYGKDVKITDFVTYSNLIPGKKYKVTGTLLIKETGKPFLNSQGKPYTSATEFTADKTDGYVKVVFEHVDTTVLSGAVVCGERLSCDGIDLITHFDLDDKDQTVTVPKIKTSACDASNGTKTLTYSETADISDTVVYSGLKPGSKYQVTGTLMNKETGRPYTDPDGKTYINTVEFTAGASEGTVEVLFKDVKITYEYTQIVVFEKLADTVKKVTIAVHEDLNDTDQTVYRPQASTVASSKKGTKTIETGSGNTKITDKVMYKGFTAGRTYSAVATLYKTNGTQITDNGVPVTGKVVFTPEKSDGTVEVPITFSLKSLEFGESVVIFENIYDVATKEETASGAQTSDIEIVRHADLNNKDQTLTYKNPRIPKTGEETSPALVAGLLILCSAAGPMGLAIKVKRGGRSRVPRRSQRKPDGNSLWCSLKRRMRDGSSRVWKNWSP